MRAVVTPVVKKVEVYQKSDTRPEKSVMFLEARKSAEQKKDEMRSYGDAVASVCNDTVIIKP